MGKTRMEELFYELYASSKQHDSWQRYAMVRELRDLMKRGSDHFERSGDEKQLPVIDDETDLLGTGSIVDSKAEIRKDLVPEAPEEESIPQVQVPIDNSEIRNVEPEEVDLGLENEEYVVLNENLEQEWDQQNVNKKIDVDGDVVYSPWVSVKRDGAVETQTCISRQANHVWKPGGFVHPKIQLDWLERADSNHEKESNKKLRKLKHRRQQKFHKTRQFQFKQQPRRNMVYTTCLRILRGGKEQERSTQVKLFKNWKFKYKHKHSLRILPCNAQHGFRGRKKSMCKLRPQQRLCVLEILERSMVPSLLSSVSVSRGILHPNESDFIEWSELLFGAYLRRDNIQQKRMKDKGCQSWKFKFKTDSKSARTNYILHQEKKPSKSPKSWKFKFKSENLRKMEVLFQHSHGLSNRLHRQDLQDLQQFITFGEVTVQLEHKWKFKGKGREVREELCHTSRETIQEGSSHCFLLVAAAYLTIPMQFGSEGNHVWHRWKARYSQNFDNRVWDPGG